MENMSSAVQWIMSKSTRTDYASDAEKGYPDNSEYLWHGILAPRMIREILAEADERGATRRDSGTEVTYNWRIGENSYSFTRKVKGHFCKFYAQTVDNPHRL